MTDNYIVIGRGLVGSAAAGYLSRWAYQVILVKPGESGDRIPHRHNARQPKRIATVG